MRNLSKYGILFHLFFLVISCKQGTYNKDASKIEIDPTIILINYKSADRATIAKGIEAINKCNPKVIGINAMFLQAKDEESDFLLSQALAQKNNVILAINGRFTSFSDENELIRSNSIFVRNSLSEGLVHYGHEGENVVSHLPFKSVGDELVWSFPITVASYYSPEKGIKFINEISGNTYYEINFKRDLDDFIVLDIDSLDNLNCETLKDKIILQGYLGPTDEDKFKISSSAKGMYSTVIMANIIIDLLNSETFEKGN